MKKFILFLILLSILFYSKIILANELLVIIGENSKNSKKWESEIFDEYNQIKNQKNLPIRKVIIKGAKFPDWFKKLMMDGHIGKIYGTPTFIIWDEVDKKEIGRFEGYTQKKVFYTKLNEAVLMIKQGLQPGKREGSGTHSNEGSSGDQRENKKPSEISKNIMDHIYKTPEEAKHFSELLGFNGEIHSHETPQGLIYMPGLKM